MSKTCGWDRQGHALCKHFSVLYKYTFVALEFLEDNIATKLM